MKPLLIKIKSLLILVLFYLSRRRQSVGERFSFIIFSKDRPMQLHALLKSLFHYTKGNFDLYVLYASSDMDYSRGYDEVKQEFSLLPIRFIEERSFKKDLNRIIDEIDEGRIFFLVDDILFKNYWHLNDIKNVNSDNEIFSLRHSKFLNYSYVVNKPQELPDFDKKDPYLVWKWKNGELDWSYPLSVDGHLFNLQDAKFWIKWLDYKSPNTFEHALQLFRRCYNEYYGKSFQNSIIFNNPCNKVQSEINNIYGNVHQSELLEKWFEGYRIDFFSYEALENKSVHEERDLKLIN